MHRTNAISKKGLHVFPPALLALLLLLTVQVALAGETGSSVESASESRVYMNLFEYRMCLARDSNWCPYGNDFRATLFNQMYITPALGADPAYFWDSSPLTATTVMTSHYPTSTVGALTRYAVDFCEAGMPTLDGRCPAVYDYDVIRCVDGTRPLFYFEPGQGAHANRWIFYVQIGGWTCDEYCPTSYLQPGNLAHASSAYNENASHRNAVGIFSNSPDNIFRNYNIVMLDKCFGDRNLGDTTYTGVYTGIGGLEEGTGPVYFHGYRVILGALRRLEREFNLGDAEQIVFVTQSNGSNGAYHYIDRLSDHISTTLGITAPVYLAAQSYLLPGPEVEYYFERDEWPANYTDIPTSTAAPGIINAPNTPQTGACGPGFDPSSPDYFAWVLQGRQVDGGRTCSVSDPVYTEAGANGQIYATEDFASGTEARIFALWGADNGPTVTWDESCVAAHASDPDLRACRDSLHVLSHHLQTPTFFSAQWADRTLRAIDEYQTRWTEANVWWPEDMKLRVELLAEVIGGYHRSDCADGNLGSHGFFIDNTVDHMSMIEMSKLTRPMRANSGREAGFLFQQQHYLMYWLDPSAPTVQCLDSGALYDAEFAPTDAVANWPQGVRCATGYYSGGSQPYQGCDDPGVSDPTNLNLNRADSRWVCQGPPILEYVYLPSIMGPYAAVAGRAP